ncbi:prepilin-type N-terminal cleavage/methylation domain-containing protein [Nocardioides sp. LHD-245]|uniref:PulJ/GspJ family protein n=1 Tax=Nocardioides sp. LHD-245 TaxID=3051387 RepID=UPI0027E1F485|nr:prepilin-type N-terminal cleavage/methylation domain-containing protein [Nocardioides sp. LHD-245]
MLRRARGDAGFTLMEVMVTVAIMGVIVTGLTGVVISYLRTTTDTRSRMTESLDLQFVTAYWQRDVSSIGVRSKDYDDDEAVHSYPTKQSVGLDRCPGDGAPVVTLAWSEYSSTVSEKEPDLVKVTYAVRDNGGGRKDLVRIRCGSAPSTTVVATNLTVAPDVICTGGGVTGCGDATGRVPTRITMTLSISDSEGYGRTTISETIAGERRQT